MGPEPEDWGSLLSDYVRGKIILGEDQIDDLFQTIRIHLNNLGITNKNLIDQVLGCLKRKAKAYTRFIKGELIDVVDESDSDKVISQTEAGLAHLFRLRHRTSNAFVFSPKGDLVLQRRVHNKRFPLYLTIFGGHVISGDSYKKAIKKEIQEELKLDGPLTGDFLKYKGDEIVFKDNYDISTDDNLEFRALYIYVLAQKEWEQVQEFQKELDSCKQKKSPEDFASWIEAEQKKHSGFGDVWGIEVFRLEDINHAFQGLIWVPEINRVVQVHYLIIQSKYAGNATEDIAYFTPDLLDRFVWKPEVMRILYDVYKKWSGACVNIQVDWSSNIVEIDIECLTKQQLLDLKVSILERLELFASAEKNRLSYLLVNKANVATDRRLKDNNNTGRRIIARELKGLSVATPSTLWLPPTKNAPSWVIPTGEGGFEMSTCNELTAQDRHFHKMAIEIYSVLEGRMIIMVNDRRLSLEVGDEVVIFPRTIHEVLQEGEFITRVLAINARSDDKTIVS